MALSPAEKQRRYRERQKRKRVESLSHPAMVRTGGFSQTFSEWVQDNPNLSSFEIPLYFNGIDPPTFDDDRGPEAYVSPEKFGGFAEDGDPFGGAKDSLGRAELMVGGLISAAVELADLINSYKKSEIQDRIARLQRAEMGDPVLREKAIEEIVHLRKVLDDLEGEVRWSFRRWKEDLP